MMQNNSNTFVIHDVSSNPPRFLDGFGGWGQQYEWSTKPEGAWCFANRSGAVCRAAHVATCGHNVRVITRKEAIELLPQHAAQSTNA